MSFYHLYRDVISKHLCTDCGQPMNWQWTPETHVAPPNAYAMAKYSQETQAITFGDLNNPEHKVSKLTKHPFAFRLLERLGTEPKVYYLSSRDWVRKLADNLRPGEYKPVVKKTWMQEEWSTKPGRDEF